MSECVSFWSVPVGARLYIVSGGMRCIKKNRFFVKQLDFDQWHWFVLPLTKGYILQPGQWFPGGQITPWNTQQECLRDWLRPSGK